MRQVDEIKNNPRLQVIQECYDGFSASVVHPLIKLGSMFVIASWGGGWEHVSVSLKNRCPLGMKCA